MPRLFGIEFAPFSIPLERRLQTLVVFQWIIGLFIYPLLSLLVIVSTLFSPLFFIPVGYLAWLYLYDIRRAKLGGRRLNFLRRLKLWEYYRDYFPISMVKTADLDPTKNYMLGYHPHGIISCGAFCNFATEATNFSGRFPGITPYMLTLETNFYWPILRGYLMALGLCDVTRESIEHILTGSGVGNAAIIVVGGAQEALDAHPGSYQLTLKSRKGFIKMALKTGAQLVPCFSFGENELFKQANNPVGSLIRKIQEKFKEVMKISPPIFYGRGVFNYSFGLMPFRTPIHTVIGAPLEVVQTSEPTVEQVNALHEDYLRSLSKLFDTHKAAYGISEEKHLQFV